MKMIAPQILQIIEKHLGSQLFAVFTEGNEIKVFGGTLNNANAEKILLNDNRVNKEKIILPFFNNGNKIVLNLYNSNGLDLLKPQNNLTLGQKIKSREHQGQIIKKMKPNIKMNVTVIFKQTDKISRINGIFTNMGMVDLVIKPAPFYNKEETLNYAAILNIYDEVGIDLTAV